MIDRPNTTSSSISPKEAESFLFHLVSHRSPSGEEARASEYLTSWLSEQGFQSYVDESGSAVGIRGQGEREIVLLGHIDTFPGEIPVRIEGRKLYGRGTVDAKGPLATFAVAASQIEPPPGTRLIIIGAASVRRCVTGKPSRGMHHRRT